MRFWIFLFFIPYLSQAQYLNELSLGLQAGLVLDIGSHENELGLELNTFGIYKMTQVNAGTRFSLVLNSFGNRKKFLEHRMNVGLMLLGGKRKTIPDQYFAGLIHNSSYNNALGYNYIWYFDNVGTSQRSGAFGLTINNSSLFFENDVFGGQAKDRFRTGHFLYSYRKDYFRVNLGLNIWTGETSGTSWVKTSNKNCPNGYKNLSSLPFGKTSNGVLYAGIQYQLPFHQSIHWRIGYDSEEIRHAFQNRFTHDLILLPKKFPRNTPHYPRLNEQGNPVFESELRKKDKYYVQLGLNGNWSE